MRKKRKRRGRRKRRRRSSGEAENGKGILESKPIWAASR
jgi:hypothetical protein